jgi:hypothetical protein
MSSAISYLTGGFLVSLLVAFNLTWSQHVPGLLGSVAVLVSFLGLVSCVLYATRKTPRSQS